MSISCPSLVRVRWLPVGGRFTSASLLLAILVGALFVTAAPAAAQIKVLPQPGDGATVCPMSAGADAGVQVICPGSAVPQVTPKGGSVTGIAGTNTYTFNVRNAGTGSGSISAYPYCSGSVATSCSASPSVFTLAAGASRSVVVTYTASGSGGTGTVELDAENSSGSSYDNGYVTVTFPPPAPTYNVSVTPDGGSLAMASGSTSYNFTVSNSGNSDATYALAVSCTDFVYSCSVPATVFVPHGGSAAVAASFTSTVAGATGTVTVSASAGGYSDAGSITTRVNDSYAVSVTPDNSQQVLGGSSTAQFYVINLGSVATTFYFSSNCGCSISPSSATINPGYGSGAYVNVTLNGVVSPLTLTANDFAHGTSDQGSIIITAPSYTVSVGPDGYSDLWREAGQSDVVNFSVSNAGNSTATYSLSGSCDGGATSCSSPPPSVTLSGGSSTTVPISFVAGSPGSSGYVRLNASGPSSDGGYMRVVVFDRSVAVGPVGQAVNVEPGTWTQTFTITNNGNAPATYTLTPTCTGVATGCSASAASVTVTNGTSAQVGVTYTATTRTATGTVQLAAAATIGSFAATGSVNVRVNDYYAVAVTPDNQAQIVSPSGAVTFYVQNLGTSTVTYSFSAACAVSCSPSMFTAAVNPGVTNGVQVQVGLNGSTGTVTFTATDAAHGVSDQGSIIVSAPSYTVSVSPDTNPATVAQQIDANKAGSQSFSVYNAGNSTATYAIGVSCPATYLVSCNAPSSLQVGSLATGTVTVTFTSTGTGGVGTMTLTASAAGTSDVGTARWQVNTHYVQVTPKGGTATAYVGAGRTQVFAVKNTGNVPNSYTLVPTCSGTASPGCTAAPASISNLGVGLTQNVTVTFTATGAGAGTIKLAAANTVDAAMVDTGSVTVTVKPTYTVAVTPDGATPQVEAWSQAVVPFTIANSGTASGRYALTLGCIVAGAVAGPCTLDATSVIIPAGQSAVVNIRFPSGAPRATSSLSVTAVSLDDGTFSDGGSATMTVTAYSVAVTPDGQAVAPASKASDTRPFTVTNTGTTTRTFTLQPSCAPPAATSCSANVAAYTLAPNVSAPVNVTYTAGDPGATGIVRLVATDAGGRSADAGSLVVTVGSTVANNSVQFKDINPGTSIARGQCLVFSIVPDVADECGALRIVHPLPAVRTLGKARVPTLIYSSDQVQGPTLAVNVTLADTTMIPQTVQLIVVRTWPDAHKDTVSRTYPGTDWQAGRRRRLSIPNVASGATGILRYSVEAWLQYAASRVLAAPADNSELAFVDRSASVFGGGWWLAGLERAYPGQYDGSVLWVAGDGSTRKYTNQRTLSGTDTVYLAPALDAPDTLLHRADGTYRRQAGNGLFVEFDGLGLHRRTVNRQGYPTVFLYDGSSRLSGIQLPPWRTGVPAHAYAFAYNATSGMLDTVTAPPVNGKTRKVVLARATGSSRVQTITELLGDSTYQVSFTPQSGLTYASRSDRKGVPTLFTYEASSPTVATFATGTGIGTDTVRHTFRTAGGLGAAGASVRLDSVYTLYDGPRLPPVIDTTKFWLDGFGAPIRIVNALGQQTTIARGDPRFPALVTETRGPAPKSFTTWATYDARGNLVASTQVNPHDDGKDATTTYAWHSVWNMVTQIIQPEGEVTNIGYDAATGDRTSQEDGRGLPSRVNFTYYAPTDQSAGAMAGLLSGVTLPATTNATTPLAAVTTQVTYDSVGNVSTTWTPRGASSTATNDAIGRTTGTTTQLTTAEFATTTLAYDLSDRLLSTISTATPMNGVGPQTITVTSVFDREGRVQRVTRKQSPDNSRNFLNLETFPPLDSLVLRYGYDNLGRKVAEFAPDSTPAVDTDNPVDSTFYDQAGNVERMRTRRNDNIVATDSSHHVIQMTYDALNRLRTRVVPDAKYRARVDGYAKEDNSNAAALYNAPYPRFPNNTLTATNAADSPFHTTWGGYTVSGFTATFDYDESGNMIVADNPDARVRRQYYANGQVRLDSLYTKTLARDTVHQYGLEYLYDRDGRRTTLKHPSQLAPSYQTQWQYDPITGALAKAIDPLYNVFTFGIDERSQPTSLAMPRSMIEQYAFDQDGDLTYLRNGTVAAAMHDVKMTYDLRGKMLTLQNAVAAHDTITMRYSGLGHLVYNNHVTWLKSDTLTRLETTENFGFDPLGNRQHSDFTRWTERKFGNCGWLSNCYTSSQTDTDLADWYYRVGTGRLVFANHFRDNRQDVTKYDESGNTVFSMQKPHTSPTVYEDRASYYAADGTLAAVDFRQIAANNSFFRVTFDEYRYDALGRRIVVRSQRLCGSQNAGCDRSYLRRTIWAGSEELYEIQMPDEPTVREYDTEALAPKIADGDGYDPNPLYGRVAYTFGAKLDQPLSVTRLGYMNTQGETFPAFSIVPLWNERGLADTSFFAATGATNCNASGRCVLVSYPDQYWTPAWHRYYAPPTFNGTLLADKADHTGQLFRRNRYYDPATGRFTQEDPIGLAGGLNAYGFADGDPINFSDPFGLCKNEKGEELPDAQCAKKLEAAQDAAMRCPAYQPSPGTTHCNQATLNVATDMGAPLGPLTDSDGNALTANEIAANLAKPGSGYRSVSAADGQALANKGVLVIAALATGGHGHVATIRPNPKGGTWPMVANVGLKNAVMGLNYAWGKNDRDKVKYYTPAQ